jgi:hypothetical protein
MLYVDIPNHSEIPALFEARADACVSIYLPTTPETQNVTLSRISFGDLTRTALEQLDAAGFDKRRHADLEEQLLALEEDDDFWRLQANSLAVLATPDSLRTFRLATEVTKTVEVSDRFHLKPLMRAMAFPQHAFVPDLPDSATDATGRASINNPGMGTGHGNAQGKKWLLLKYLRKVTPPCARSWQGVRRRSSLLRPSRWGRTSARSTATRAYWPTGYLQTPTA